ncbi:MAG TPA: hypothetical protein PK055_01040 [Gammaproteobacteria bacterium]|nr:hypothetical protein [Gammaproteobacteria bacterium]
MKENLLDTTIQSKHEEELSYKVTDKTVLNKVEADLKQPSNDLLKEFQTINGKLHYHEICGSDVEIFYQKQRFLDSSFSQKQESAKNNFIEMCKKWFDYLDTISKEEKDNLEKNIKDMSDSNMYFLKDGIDIYDRTKLEDAKKILNSGGDDTVLTHTAITYLLYNDYNLLNAIAEDLGTTDGGYIKNARNDIAMQYKCETSPSACSPNSIEMVYLCLTNEYACGMSYSQYLASTRTPGQYNDILTMAAILRKLIADGYFSEELE